MKPELIYLKSCPQSKSIQRSQQKRRKTKFEDVFCALALDFRLTDSASLNVELML